MIRTPSESGTSPSLGEYLPHAHLQQQQQQQQQQQGSSGGGGGGGLTARFVPGMGIQMLPNDGPVSPTTYARLGGRNSFTTSGYASHPLQQQQQQQVQTSQGSMFSQPLQRRASSDYAQYQLQQQQQQGGTIHLPLSPHQSQSGMATHQSQSGMSTHQSGAQGGLGAQGVHDLGKGVPLHSVASCPLYIVEFKAGRTDLFYAMPEGARDIRLVFLSFPRSPSLSFVSFFRVVADDPLFFLFYLCVCGTQCRRPRHRRS